MARDTRITSGDLITTPVGFLKAAIRAVPAVKYALGVGGIAAVVTIVASFQPDYGVAVFGTVIVLGLMFVLVVFARLTTMPGRFLHGPMIFATWVFVLLLATTSFLLMTGYFFAWPKQLETMLRRTEAGHDAFPLGMKVIDSYYYSIDSLEQTIPNVVGRGGVIPTDDQSQIDFFRLNFLRAKPVIRVQIHNYSSTDKLMVKDIWLNFNGQKYWWHFSLPPQGPNEIMAPPNSDTVISGVPLEYPYLVRSAENFELQNSLPIDARNAFEEIGLTAKKPTELWAKLAIIANGKLVISSQLFRINKNNVRQYQPGSEF